MRWMVDGDELVAGADPGRASGVDGRPGIDRGAAGTAAPLSSKEKHGTGIVDTSIHASELYR